MKKIILFITIINFTFIANAQTTTFEVKQTSIGTYNCNGELSYSKPIKTDLSIYYYEDKGMICVKNNFQDIYYINYVYEPKSEKESTVYTFRCIDKDGNKCEVIFQVFSKKHNTQVYVIYKYDIINYTII